MEGSGRQVHYPPLERPAIEALDDDGRWCPGRLHAWIREESGWYAVVTFRTGPGLHHHRLLPAERVRQRQEGPEGLRGRSSGPEGTPDSGPGRGGPSATGPAPAGNRPHTPGGKSVDFHR